MSDRVTSEWGNFFMTPNIIIDEYGPKLGVYGLAIYSILARKAGQDGESFPAVPTIARIAGCSENKVRETIKHMVALGLIKVEERRRENGGQTSNLYILLVPKTHQVNPPPSPDEAPPLHTVNPKKTHIEQDSIKDSLPVTANGEKVSHKKRDLIYEMVCKEIFNFEYVPGRADKIPPSLRGWINGVTADLRAIDCTPQELRECMQDWDKEHGDGFNRPQAREKVTQAVLAYREKRKPKATPVKHQSSTLVLDVPADELNARADELERLKREMEAKHDKSAA